MTFDPRQIRADFPIFAAQVRSGHELVYLDNGATTQKPGVVIDAERDFYSTEYGTVHRGIYHLSAVATAQYEAARETVADFVNARLTKEIIFTRSNRLNQFGCPYFRRSLYRQRGRNHSLRV
jgi:cysteine desulfurase / selenocysteine lyase